MGNLFVLLILWVLSAVYGITKCSSWNSLLSWFPWLYLLSFPLSISLCCFLSLLLPLKHWNSLGFSPRMVSLPSCTVSLTCLWLPHLPLWLSPQPGAPGSNTHPPWITSLGFLLCLKLHLSEKKPFAFPLNSPYILPDLYSLSPLMTSPPVWMCWSNLRSFLPAHLPYT